MVVISLYAPKQQLYSYVTAVFGTDAVSDSISSASKKKNHPVCLHAYLLEPK